MLGKLISLQFFIILVLVSGMAAGLALVCARLQVYLVDMAPGEWLMDHVFCPLARVILLLIAAALTVLLARSETSFQSVFALFVQPAFLLDAVNILFVSSLIFSFAPIVKHPSITIPLLGLIATALVLYHDGLRQGLINDDWIPAAYMLPWFFAYMLIVYLFSVRSAAMISHWIDYRFNVTRTGGLVLEVHFIVLHLPLLLAYGRSLTSE